MGGPGGHGGVKMKTAVPEQQFKKSITGRYKIDRGG